MASSKVISTTNQDLPRQPTLCSSLSSLIADLQNHSNHNAAAQEDRTTMDDLLKDIYSPEPHAPYTPRESKSVDEVWKEIVSGGGEQPQGEGITLEDFLTKAGAVREEDVGVPVGAGAGSYGVDAVVGKGRARGKRRLVEVDKATQQKQRRMIKNRESAARSRERKQAYTVELESLVTQLEEEHARLVRDEKLQVEKKNERFTQLMENLIPVVEKRKPPRSLRRVNSWQW